MISLKADKSEVLRYLGYKGQAVSLELESEISSLIAEGECLITPRFVFEIFDLAKNANEIIVNNTNLVLRGKDIYSLLENAKKCAVMAVTIGTKIESAVIRYEKSGEMKKAAILDCVATELTEKIADYCNREIVKKAKEINMYCSYRFSPGYGDLPLETQKEIIPLLNTERSIGVTLSDTCLMSPRKSVTAIIGLFETEQRNEKSGCESCNLKDSCGKRKAGEGCGI